MAKAAKPATQATEAEEADAPKKSKKKLILFIAAVVLLVGGGAAAFMLLNPAPAPKRGGAAPAEEARPGTPPKFVDLGQFTANMAREDEDRYLQVAISLKITKPELEDKIKESKPEILHRVNMLLQSKRPSELATFDGKEKLAQQIKAQVDDTTSDFDKEKLQERLGKLAGGVAVIKIGAGTEVELKEKKHRVEDALSATRAAVEEGIVPGGGVALLNAVSALDSVEATGDELTGVNILRRALEEPIRRLCENAGEEGSVIVDLIRRKQRETGNMRVGYDVLKNETVDMNQRGIIDPAKVTRSALENAASIAAMILTTEALITDLPEKKSAMAMPPGGMGDY